MPKNMFGDVVDPSVKMGNKSGYTVALTMVLEVLAIAAIAIVPLMASGILPSPQSSMTYTVTAIKVPAPPPPPSRPDKVTPPTAGDTGVPPKDVPTGFKPEPASYDREFERAGIPDSVPGGGKADFDPPPPPAPTAVAPKEPVRIGGDVKPPQKVKHVNPVYPAIAQSARVQGIVIIEATIGPDGRVTDARVLRSIPLLDDAALQAVKEWQFTPTLLNKEPVPVVMTVTVQFSLQ
jgi:periplasmic protein TonB